MLATGLMFSTQAASAAEDQAYAVSFFTFFRSAGQCVGIAIGGSVFQNSIRWQIEKHESIASTGKYWSLHTNELGEFVKGLQDGQQSADYVQSYADALKIVWIVPCVLCAAALVASLFTQRFSLDMVLNTDQGFRHQPGGMDDRDAREMDRRIWTWAGSRY